MADVITGNTELDDLTQTAFDRRLYFALRSQPVFDAAYDVKPAQQAMPGSAVTFSFMDNLATATSALTEESDVDRAALSETQVTATLAEQGNAVGLTALLRATSFGDIDSATANILGYNAVDSLDVLARDPLTAGDNVIFSGDATERADITPGDTLAAADVREAVAELRTNSAVPKKANYYLAYIHPHVSYDFRTATAAGNWRESHLYASPESIFAGEIGAIEGAIFIETPRARIFADAGSSPTTTDVYATIVCGQQAGGKAEAIALHMVQSPVVDRLRRLPSWGWYGLFDHIRFREDALYRIESSSALGA